jgi:diphthamide biosynthesis methyltransferase
MLILNGLGLLDHQAQTLEIFSLIKKFSKINIYFVKN